MKYGQITLWVNLGAYQNNNLGSIIISNFVLLVWINSFGSNAIALIGP